MGNVSSKYLQLDLKNFFFLALPHSSQHLSSPARTHSESTESQPVDCPGIPNDLKKLSWSLLQSPLVRSRKNLHDRYILLLGLPPQIWENALLLFKPLGLWRSEARDEGVGRMGFFHGLSHWPVDGHHLCAPHGLLLCVSVPFISSYEDTNHIWLGFTLMASFHFYYLFQHPISRYCHILRYWSVGL